MKSFALAVLLFLQAPAAPRIQNGVVTGRIQSLDGHAAAKVRVFAIQAGPGAAGEKSILAAIAQTDGDGRFQLQDLRSGSYYIAAGLQESLTYYPGVTQLPAALSVAVASGKTSPGLDFTLDPTTLDTLTEVKQVPQDPGPIRSTGKAVTSTTKLELLEDGPVKFHYLGWDAGFDEVVPRSRLQLDDKAIEQTRQPAIPNSTEKISTLSPKPENTEKGAVPADAGPIESTGKAVTASTKLDRNQVLQVESDNQWWAARVIELLQDGRVKIHYLGWDAGFDEVVTRSRLQWDDKAIEKTQR